MANSTGGSGLSRRSFIQSTGAVAVGSVAIQSSSVEAAADWDNEIDVIVAGSGCAGLSAAVGAVDQGASVLVLEKGPVAGGQTQKSHGVGWIPNNYFMRERGLADSREDALRYMARLAHPDRYNPFSETLGMPEDTFALMGVFYDNAANIAKKMHDSGAWRQKMPIRSGKIAGDYYAHLPENKNVLGRPLETDPGEGRRGFGADMIIQMRTYCEGKGAKVLVNHRVSRIVREPGGRVVGVTVKDPTGKELRLRARKGVVFGTGGFAMNDELCSNYLRGSILGSTAVPQNEGDLIPMALEIGAKLGSMNEAWMMQVILEEALQSRAIANPVFVLSCDSAITVSKYGKRIYDEKFIYNERARSHYDWDAVKGEYPNYYQFFVYDKRAAEIEGQAIPPNVPNSPYVIEGDTIDGLAKNISARLTALKSDIGDVSLSPDFADNLKATIKKFNEYAITGVDLDFSRGVPPIDADYNPRNASNTFPNGQMYPIADSGPYYCVMIAPGAVDTKGGPTINENAQIVDYSGIPIPGLYAAGNCAASPSGQAFWAAGATLGLAMTFGYIAGQHAGAA